ncbi:MAG: MBOAT family O-acyltransferase [Bacteroidales bacterium]
MLFSSAIFIFSFLPVAVGLYLLLPRRLKNLFLLLASLFFYTWGEKEIVVVLIVTTLADFSYSLLIDKGHRKTGLWLSVITNVAFLGFFKYFNFAFENFRMIMEFFGITDPILQQVPAITLPIGISFYTFQTMSYTIDVYRGKVKVSRNIIDYAAFVTMFPQLVAGPIVRYSDIQDQLRNKKINVENFALGLQRFIIGLAKKMLIANAFAQVADMVFSHPPAEWPTLVLWMGIIAYALQLYYDFSGYSDMAIGIGRMLGFRFPENFNYPYISQSIREMWQRWHITLSTWFRDYLYISLGGSRVPVARVYLNLVIVFVVTGLWHGAAWNFVLWGLANGVFIVIEKLGFSHILERLPKPARHFYTMFAWIVTLVIFRSPGVSWSGSYLVQMFSFAPGNQSLYSYFSFFHFQPEMILLMALGILFCMPVYGVLECRFNDLRNRSIALLYSVNALQLIFYAALFLASVAYLAADTYNPFIYFRF